MCRKVKVFEYDTLDSTNAEAKRYALSCKGFEPVLFVARSRVRAGEDSDGAF